MLSWENVMARENQEKCNIIIISPCQHWRHGLPRYEDEITISKIFVIPVSQTGEHFKPVIFILIECSHVGLFF
jgi:hypothetical protein